MSFATIAPELHRNTSDYLGWRDIYSLMKTNRYFNEINSPHLLSATVRLDGQFPLLRAAETGNEALIQLLLNKHHVMVSPPGDNDTAIHIAALHAHVGIIQLLIKARVEANLTRRGTKPTHLLTQSSEYDYSITVSMTSCMEKLVVPPRFKKHNGRHLYPPWIPSNMRTPLHLAALHNTLDVMRLLFAAGANPAILCSMDIAPPSYAAMNNYEAAVKAMVMGWDVKDFAFGPALAVAIYPDHKEKIVEVLLSHANSDPEYALGFLDSEVPMTRGQAKELERRLYSQAKGLGIGTRGFPGTELAGEASARTRHTAQWRWMVVARWREEDHLWQ